MNKKTLYLGLGAIALVLFSYGLFYSVNARNIAKLKDNPGLVAEINGFSITADQLYTTLKGQGGTSAVVNAIDTYIANKEYPTTAAMMTSAQEQADSYKLQYTQSGQDFASVLAGWGFANEAAFKEALLLDSKKTMLVKQYLTDQITDAQIEAFYASDIYGALTVKHILIVPVIATGATTATAASEAAALAKANEVITKLKAGSKFDDLAKTYSEDTATKDKGGLITDMTSIGYDAAFFKASLALKDGAYTTTPVKSAYGYHVILRISQKAKPSFAEAKADIINALLDKMAAADTNLSAKTLDKVRTTYKFKIYDSGIKTIYNNNISSLK